MLMFVIRKHRTSSLAFCTTPNYPKIYFLGKFSVDYLCIALNFETGIFDMTSIMSDSDND